ncbi:hypothetical protein [Bradyrhizobium sp.]|uniref:hypothetical protein n=1 Tax=Bradyrhizobium sp. TaxID=376 RepID=UPI0040377600
MSISLEFRLADPGDAAADHVAVALDRAAARKHAVGIAIHGVFNAAGFVAVASGAGG